MQSVYSEHDIGKFYIDDIKDKSISLKIQEHNTIVSGNIVNPSNNSTNNLELVLYKFDVNSQLIEIDRVKTDSDGSYKFHNVLIGNYIIKNNEFTPDILNTNQILANTNQYTRLPFRAYYNVANGFLQNGARLSSTRDKVIFIGGPDNGSSSLYVYVTNGGQHEMEIEYIGGARPFNIDINRKNTGQIYTTSNQYFGKLILTINLRPGGNLLKFYGHNRRFAPTLGVFTLTLIEKGEITYNLTKGVLQNGAIINTTTDFVSNLGGAKNGSVKIIVNVDERGYYLVNINFKYGGRPFLVSVNRISTGEIYITQAEHNGKYSFQVYLDSKTNEIRFYGLDTRRAPDLGRFELIYIKQSQIQPDPPKIPIDPLPIPPKKHYNVANGILGNLSVLSNDKKFVLYLGGYNEGTSTITVNVENAGTYKIAINYINGSRPFKMDVNTIYTGEIYKTPRDNEGIFITTINLNSGNNTIKFYGIYNEHASYLGSFSLELHVTQPPIVPPPPPILPVPPAPPQNPNLYYYRIADGILENGAALDSSKYFVLYIGGSNNGSSTVTVNVVKTGKYNIDVDFQNGYRPLKIDVNQKSTGKLYTTPAGHLGTFTTIIDLNAGNNTIKFYGVLSQHASNLGRLILEYILTPPTPTLPPGTYDTANGVFENNAILDITTNFVTNLGGNNDGGVIISINVQDAGIYKIGIKYLAAESNRNLRVDINSKNAGIFTPMITNGWALADVKLFEFQILLNAGDNEIKFHGDGVNPAPNLGTFVVKAVNNPPQLPDYTFQTLNKLSYSDLVNVIKTIGWYDIPGLFDFSRESYDFFYDDNRIQAIIDELEQSGHFFTAQDEKGIDTLVEFLRAGFYLAYYNSQLSKLYDINYRNKCIPAIKAVLSNPNFKLGTKVQDKVVKAIGKLMGNASGDFEIINDFSKVLDQYKINIANYSNDSEKSSAIFKIARETTQFLNTEITRNGNDPQSTNFYNRIDSFITQIEGLAEEGYKAVEKSEWLVKNFIDITGNLSRFRSNKGITQRALTNCVNNYFNSPGIYLEVLSQIKRYFNSQLSNGTTINYDQELERLRKLNLPNEYRFDNGEVIIRTGIKVTKDKVNKLYWASKEVKAQFIRICGNDAPLDTGNADDVLKIFIYNSPEHYKINYQLYGFSTDNGGVYYEHIGTFFTYDRRVPEDSIYSLDELFRHEFTHYLQGRFLINGIGISNFSKGIIWFTEGTAELFAGATRKEGIKARKAIVRSLANDRRNMMSLSSLFSAKYGSFNFYKYGFAFSYCMYSKNLSQFKYMADTIRNNNPTEYENYLQTLKSDQNTNSSYEQTIDKLINNLGNLTSPHTSDDYLSIHSNMTVSQVSSDIQSIFYMSSVSTETKSSEDFETISIKGSYNNGISIDSLSDFNSINKKLDTALSNLEKRGWSGYKTFTVYCANYRVDRHNYAIFDVVFHGILRNF